MKAAEKKSMTAKNIKNKAKTGKTGYRGRLGQKLFMGRVIYTYGINYRERAWKKNPHLKCIFKSKRARGEKKRHGMLLKKHDEKDSVGASRKW